MRVGSARTAAVAIGMDRGHLDPPVATLPSAAERCGPVGERAAALGWPLGTDDIVRALGG